MVNDTSSIPMRGIDLFSFCYVIQRAGFFEVFVYDQIYSFEIFTETGIICSVDSKYMEFIGRKKCSFENPYAVIYSANCGALDCIKKEYNVS